jgi:hypothetical protein
MDFYIHQILKFPIKIINNYIFKTLVITDNI